MKAKFCPKCQLELPLSSYTSTRSHYCNNCRIIRKFEQQNASRQRQIDRLKNKKQKTKVRISLPELKAKVQRKINKYCRDRDVDKGCISCGKHVKLQGGHYINQGSCSFLRYDFMNIHGQCVPCNHFKSGNLIEYRASLVKKIGLAQVKRLESLRHETYKWTREELNKLLEKYI